MKRFFMMLATFFICLGISIPAYALDVPQQPDISGMSAKDANILITDYNDKVDAYNQWLQEQYEAELAAAQQYNADVDAYNQQLDEDYAQTVSNIEATNAQIEKSNAAERSRVQREKNANTKAQEEADAQNALIDQENEAARQAAEQAKLDNEQMIADKAAYDAQVDKDYEDAVAAEAARVEQYNADQDRQAAANKETNAKRKADYEAAIEQYPIDLAQYEKDLAYEEKILALGYESVQAYNDKINAYYNEPADKAIAANKKGTSTPSTIKVQKGEESGNTVTVTVKHTYYVNGSVVSTRTEVVTVDFNDIVTVYPDAYFYESVEPGTVMFYRFVSNEYLQGYWWETDSYAGYNTIYYQNGWACGDTHTFSYKDGGKYGVCDDIVVYYNYDWVALKKAKTYNVPNPPTYPEEPTYLDEEPHYITAQPIEKGEYLVIELKDETYTIKDHVQAKLIDVKPAAIRSTLPIPEKDPYKEYIELPQVPVMLDKMELLEVIEDEETPLFGNSWALVNLIAMIISIVFMLIVPKKEEEKRYRMNLIPVILTLASVGLFVWTENVHLNMAIWDQYSVYMIILAIGSIICKVFAKKNVVDKTEN